MRMRAPRALLTLFALIGAGAAIVSQLELPTRLDSIGDNRSGALVSLVAAGLQP